MRVNLNPGEASSFWCATAGSAMDRLYAWYTTIVSGVGCQARIWRVGELALSVADMADAMMGQNKNDLSCRTLEYPYDKKTIILGTRKQGEGFSVEEHG